MKKVLLALIIVACFSSAVLGRLMGRVCVIVNTDNAPVEITDFVRHGLEDKDHITSIVKYVNRTEKDIEAVAIALLYYGPFNEKEEGVRGISTNIIRPQREGDARWSVYGKPMHVKTAIAYVSAVRFGDGEIWKADTEEVIKEAGKLAKLEFLSETEILEILEIEKDLEQVFF